MERGTVKWFNNRRGLGLITVGFGEQDVLVENSALAKNVGSLVEGQAVEFELVRDDRGARARDVRPVDHPFGPPPA